MAALALECVLQSLGDEAAWPCGAPHLSAEPLLSCCRNHATLNSFQAIAAVRRIVLGYGRRNPDAPFTRNLNFVVAFLLAVLGLDREEDVFWILTALLEQCLHPSCVLEVSVYALCSPLVGQAAQPCIGCTSAVAG